MEAIIVKKYPGVFSQKGRKGLMISWYVNGKRFYESAHTDDPVQAYALRCKRLSDASEGVVFSPKVARIKFEELAEDMFTIYENEGRTSLYGVKKKFKKHILPFFGYRRVAAITS